MHVIIVLIIIMTRSVHVEEIDQVHEYDFSENAYVTVIVKKMKMALKNISNILKLFVKG